MQSSSREERLYSNDRIADQRGPFQRDRDRIIYTSAFRRLAWVTQVVSAEEGEPFHNRLTHTLEVAQIGRRLAEKLRADQPDEADSVGGVDPEVVEAAALAHDLGHPPFGHAAERELDRLMREAEIPDGFEGNPQSFRVVAKLAIRDRESPGLNLTRATLDAILKYPWFRQTTPPERNRKWGAYNSERKEFEWVRGPEPRDFRKSAEAEIMDFADDIAYAVHDVEDFYRTGLIPLDRLVKDDDEVDKFLDGTFSNLESNGRSAPFGKDECKSAFKEILESTPVIDPYSGTGEQRARLRSLTAGLIGRYVNALKLQVPGASIERRVHIEEWVEIELFVFKQLTWYYVINNSALASQQFGQRRIIGQLFEIFSGAAEEKMLDIFPASYRDRMQEMIRDGRYDSKEERVRVVADLIAGMTEHQAVSMYQRLTGVWLGTVMDTIVR